MIEVCLPLLSSWTLNWPTNAPQQTYVCFATIPQAASAQSSTSRAQCTQSTHAPRMGARMRRSAPYRYRAPAQNALFTCTQVGARICASRALGWHWEHALPEARAVRGGCAPQGSRAAGSAGAQGWLAAGLCPRAAPARATRASSWWAGADRPLRQACLPRHEDVSWHEVPQTVKQAAECTKGRPNPTCSTCAPPSPIITWAWHRQHYRVPHKRDGPVVSPQGTAL